LSDEQFDAAAAVIVRGLQDGSINTRTINKVSSPRFTKLMGEIRDAVGMPAQPVEAESASAPGASTGTGGSQGPATPTTSGTQSPKKPSPPKRPPVKKVHFLNTGIATVPDAYPVAIRLHLEELSVIDIQRFPNATFLMLRAILEKSIKAYAEAKNVDIGKTPHNNKGMVQLYNCLSWLVEYLKANGPADLVQPTQRVQSGKLANYTSSNNALNAINHNHKFHVDPDNVIDLWHSIDPLMRELMKP
jgi:hypothetical protein